VERLNGSAEAKKRLVLILETLAGEQTTSAAGRLLGITRRRFDALRRQFLLFGLSYLEPRPPGRPGQTHVADRRVSGLEAQVQRLQVDLRAAEVREEIALALPHLLRRSRGKKGSLSKTPRAKSSIVQKPVT
jgi:hypothetical protein